MKTYGNAGSYIGASSGRPVPKAPDLDRHYTPHTATSIPTGRDWGTPPPAPAPAPVTLTRVKPVVRRPRAPRRSLERTVATSTPAARPPRVPRPTAAPTSKRSGPDTAEIIRRYVDLRHPIPQIAEELHHGKGTVRNAILDAGITLRDDRTLNSGGRNAKSITDYDPALVEQVRRLYIDDRKSTEAIARTIGRSAKLVATILTRSGTPLRPPANVVPVPPLLKLTDAQVDELVARYEAGEPAVRLAPDFGVSLPTALKRLRDRGVTIRTRGGQRKATA